MSSIILEQVTKVYPNGFEAVNLQKLQIEPNKETFSLNKEKTYVHISRVDPSTCTSSVIPKNSRNCIPAF